MAFTLNALSLRTGHSTALMPYCERPDLAGIGTAGVRVNPDFDVATN